MTLFDFDDVLLMPHAVTRINSRSEIYPFDDKGGLPLFTAPMDTVVNAHNSHYFKEQCINVILPRTTNTDLHPKTSFSEWISYGLTQFEDVFIKNDQPKESKHHILLDVANGHMPAVHELTRTAKEKYGDSLVLMVGNVANPETYALLSDAGADYVRIGIGNGGGCLTTVHTGVGYPMASLIVETYKVSCTLEKPAQIVADGGFKKYSDVIKALALGADYVMLGSIFNKALESAGDTVDEGGERINQYNLKAKEFFKAGGKLYKKFRGMSTKEVQASWGKTDVKTSEGVVRMHAVEYTIDGWVDNFKHYLTSAMSYTDAKNLSEFIGRAKYNLITEASFKRFNK
jgi:IMP dehydrogenase/GMP reductase